MFGSGYSQVPSVFEAALATLATTAREKINAQCGDKAKLILKEGRNRPVSMEKREESWRQGRKKLLFD